MYFGYTDDEKIVKKSVRDLFQDKFNIEKVRKFIDNPEFPRELQEQIAGIGLIGLISREGDKVENLMPLLAAFEEFGRALIPYPLIESVTGAYALSLDPNQVELLGRVMEGQALLTVAWESEGEPAAEKGSDGYTASGSFIGVPFANAADHILAFFTLRGTNELAAVVLNRDHPGVRVSVMESMDHTFTQCKVDVSNYSFTEKDMVRTDIGAARLKAEMEDLAALFASAELTGVAEEAFNKTVEYTKIRKQFGQEIARFQALKHMAANMYVWVESCKVAVLYAGWAREEGVEPETISIAKAYASQAAMRVTGMCIQMHGGIGYTWESDMHLYFKRARRAGSQYGDAYLHRERVMQHAIKAAGL